MRAYPRHQAARPSARSAPTPQPPQLDDEAWELVASMPRSGASGVSSEEMFALASRVSSNPSPSGIQALTFLAWSCREAARKKHTSDASLDLAIAEVLEKQSADAARLLKTTASLNALEAKVTKWIHEAYAAGHLAGRQELQKELEADRSLPVRRTEFVSDATGKITGKIEYQLKPEGGKKS
jgi:hypothetical protein